MGRFDWLRHRMRKWITPRQNTDMESEILNIISAPIYVYTITSVYFYSCCYVVPYLFSNTHMSTGLTIDRTENESCGCFSMCFLNRVLFTLIYFEMMSNWLCIRYVSNRIDKSVQRTDANSAIIKTKMAPTSSIILGSHETSTSSDNQWCGETSTYRTRQENQSVTVPEQKRSYWSWNVCLKCGHDSPPRCHHCPMCETCVLKRDHHCFFSGRCVGFNNQRYFIVFLGWAAFGTSYSTLCFLPYLWNELWETMSIFDLIPPLPLIRWLTGNGSGFITGVIFAYFFNFLFVMLSSTFLVEQYSLICSGLTQFETKGLNKRKLNITDPRNFRDKVKAVMGHYFGLSLFFPLTHLIFPPHENPYEWSELEIHRENGKEK